jgi:FAD/FMN-containing dehydrogenase
MFRRGFTLLLLLIGSGQMTIISSQLAECLGPQLAEFLVTPASAEYEELRNGIAARVTRSPHAILQLQRLSDVTTAVNCARQNGISPVPRSGKHSYESLSSMDNQLVIDLGNCAAVNVLPNQDVATFESGATLGQIYTELWNQGGYSFNAGNCPSVGAGGHLLGGGYGFQSRKYALSSDQIIAMNVVLADGTEVVANATSHTDLYWALRGGGAGSFGIVTQFTVNVFKEPVNTVFRIDFTPNATVLDHWQRYFIHSAPIELTATVTVFKKNIEIVGHYTGSKEALEQFLDSTGTLRLSTIKWSIIEECNILGIGFYSPYYPILSFIPHISYTIS